MPTLPIVIFPDELTAAIDVFVELYTIAVSLLLVVAFKLKIAFP